jgi:uncharacterized membrane protein
LEKQVAVQIEIISENVLGEISRTGAVLFAVSMMYFGYRHFTHGPGISRIVPAWMPWRLFWVYFTGVGLSASGLSILVRKCSRLAAFMLGVMLMSFVLLIHVPSMISSMMEHPGDLSALWFNSTGGVNNALKDIALAATAFMIAAHSTMNQGLARVGAVATSVFGGILVLYGIEHFIYTGYTPGIPSLSLVTFWIPGRLFWGYVSGAALFWGGMSILLKKRTLEAAAWLGLMTLLLAILNWALRVAADQSNIGEIMNSIKDIGIAGGIWTLARNCQGVKEPCS